MSFLDDKKVLIVDDEEINCMMLEMAFEDICEVQSVYSGEDCIKAMPSFEPDIVLLDINMPGMTGIEACKKLKSNPETSDIPVVFVTALESQDIRKEATEAGGTHFFTKPTDPDELVDSVHKILVGAR